MRDVVPHKESNGHRNDIVGLSGGQNSVLRTIITIVRREEIIE
jgi:hypothetical protein